MLRGNDVVIVDVEKETVSLKIIPYSFRGLHNFSMITGYRKPSYLKSKFSFEMSFLLLLTIHSSTKLDFSGLLSHPLS